MEMVVILLVKLKQDFIAVEVLPLHQIFVQE